MDTQGVIGVLVLLAIFQGFVCSHFCGVLANEKGYPAEASKSWAMAGFWLGVIALIAATGLPDRIAYTWDDDET